VRPSQPLRLNAGEVLEKYADLLNTRQQSRSAKSGTLDRFGRSDRQQGKLYDSTLPILNKLPRLVHLELSRPFVSVGAVSRLSLLPKLHYLSLNWMPSVSPVLKVLSTSDNISEISLKNVPVTEADMRLIAQMKRLRSLKVNLCDITATDLEALSPAKKLLFLGLNQFKGKPADIVEVLKKFKHLHELKPPFEVLDDKAIAELRKALPMLKALR